MDLTRREFLITGSAVGAIPVQGAPWPKVIYAGANDGNPELFDHSTKTLCQQCPGGCGLAVRVVNNSVVGIAGNPAHPINRGGVCARGPAALQTLYNPDRLSRPAILAGPKGSGRYTPIDWSEAIKQLATKLQSVRKSTGPHTVAVVMDGDRGLKRLAFSRFLQAFGSNNLIDWSPDGHLVDPAIWAMQGFQNAVGYDLARTEYVLSFGSQWLDAHWSPAQASRSFAAMRRGRKAARPRFVHIEPRLSLTGAKADEWIPIRPGTEGALALGLAHVLLREGLYDREFVEKRTHGFDDPVDGKTERIGYRRLVLSDYTPAKVAKITGIEEGTIFRLAREFAAHKPALALGFDGSGVSTQRCYDRMAIHSLNALVGSLDVPGGVVHFKDVDLLTQPMPAPDEIAEQGLEKPRIDDADLTTYALGDMPPHPLAEHILANVPYPIEVLILAGANPVFDSPHPERMKQMLAKVPFVVSLSPWLDDSTRWADLVIPEKHFLSRWDMNVAHTLTGRSTVSISQPVVASPPGARGTVDLLLELAQKIGSPVKEALPFKNAQSMVRAACDTLYASGRGAPFGPEEEENWTRLLERGGWRSPLAVNADEFYQRVVDSGGWTDPIYYYREWDRVFRSPPRRFAFHSVIIAEHIKPTTMYDDIRCLPHYEATPEADPEATFPLHLYVYPLTLLAGLRDANVPWLMDVCGAYMGERWRSWVEINPETARHLGIEDGEQVVVTSSRGKLQAVAKLFEGIRPDTLAMPWGLGHEGGGRWAADIGQRPSELVDVKTDPLTSSPIWNATLVSLRKT